MATVGLFFIIGGLLLRTVDEQKGIRAGREKNAIMDKALMAKKTTQVVRQRQRRYKKTRQSGPVHLS